MKDTIIERIVEDICVWYESSTNPEGKMENPEQCKNCDGTNKYCSNYISENQSF